MNQQQLEGIRQQLDQFDQFDLPAALAESHSDTSLTSGHFEDTPALDFLSTASRMLKQLRAEVDGPNAGMLPPGFYWETSTHPMNHWRVLELIQRFWTGISGKDWLSASRDLELLVGYQMQTGFWDRGTKSLYPSTRLKQHKLFSDVELRLAEMAQATESAHSASRELRDLIQQRLSESTQMTASLAECRQQQQEIASLLNEAKSADGSLKTILSTQQTTLQEVNAAFSRLLESEAELKKKVASSAEVMTRTDQKLQFLQEKEIWIKELAGIAAETGLGWKFEARKRELRLSARLWLAGVLLAVVGGATWLVKSHDWLWHDGRIIDATNIWLVVGVNLGVLAPVLIGLGFVIQQYSKERHYQEEYAFRASVAMTMSAIADRLEGAKGEKETLIRSTVEKLYELPTMLRPPAKTGFLGFGRAIKDPVQAFTDLVKEIKKSE